MVTIKSKKEIELLREGGKILASILEEIVKEAKVGVSTAELEKMAEKRIKKAGAQSSFKNYKNKVEDKPFPTCLCTSINSEIVHAPSLPGRKIKNGDVLGLDLGIKYKGLYTDMAVTIGVGKVNQMARKLIKVTKKALVLAQSQIKPGNYVADISKAVQDFAQKEGFNVVRSLVGHGVGYAVHEEPRVPNYIEANQPKIELKEGMVLAIEPMVTVGSYILETKGDGWTQVTVDGSLAAHYENTVVVTKNGCEVLTKV